MSAMFHPRSGRCVYFSNGNKTAIRTNPTQEFNRGLIFSLEPIKDNEIFEVKIDKKVRNDVWQILWCCRTKLRSPICIAFFRPRAVACCNIVDVMSLAAVVYTSGSCRWLGSQSYVKTQQHILESCFVFVPSYMFFCHVRNPYLANYLPIYS